MKVLLILLVLGPTALLAQSPFDGTWVLDPPVPQKPIDYSLANGVFRCSGCIANVEVKADGIDHKVAETDYWDTLNVRPLDSRAVEIIAKKADKTMYMEFASVSPDGSTLTQVIKDTTESDTVTIETLARRMEKGGPDAHAISGSWKAYQTNRSSNGSLINYKCTKEGFSAETPLGEKYAARFDGKFYPVEDDPGHTLVAAKLINPNTVELTHKRNDKIVSVARMTVAPDGKTIHVVFENKDAGTTTTFDFHRQK
ncbi:MAG TPA: hypothetical protein VMG82_23105 [Candidatus Sulfotelmatobacter sp.]|nr:hypothetical protein [Candidatus Sulfotelmatobacter sp.]